MRGAALAVTIWCLGRPVHATLPDYHGMGLAINPDGACANTACYQELPDECCPLPYNYQGGFLGAQQDLVSTLGFWKTVFVQTACQPRCQALIFGRRFRTCVHANKLYAENFEELLGSNVCNGACMYSNKAAWQQLVNATGPCTGLSTQPGSLSCPSDCADILRLVTPNCRSAATSVTYKGFGEFIALAFRACSLEVPQLCSQAGYEGCALITDTAGSGSSAGSVVVNEVLAAGGELEGS